MRRAFALTLPLIVVILTIGSNVKQQQSQMSDFFIPKQINFTGLIEEEEALSAIGMVGKYLILGADEGRKVQILEPQQNSSIYQVINNIKLPIKKSGNSEIDIEGIAVEDNTVYVVGSHTVTEKNKKKGKKANNRQNVFRFQLDLQTGQLASKIKQDSLKKILKNDSVLEDYLNVPNKDNGIDIEGVAVKDKYLYFGFRTPILKKTYSPVIVTKFKNLAHKNKYQLRHVDLSGNGIRDMVSVNQGFLILADATAEDAAHYQVYFWDGKDDLAKTSEGGATKFLARIPTAPKSRAEGITILEETSSTYLVLIIYDGVAQGNPTILEINKSGL